MEEDLRREVEALVTHLAGLDMDIDADCFSEVLKALLRGETANQVVDDFGLEDGNGV